MFDLQVSQNHLKMNYICIFFYQGFFSILNITIGIYVL